MTTTSHVALLRRTRSPRRTQLTRLGVGLGLVAASLSAGPAGIAAASTASAGTAGSATATGRPATTSAAPVPAGVLPVTGPFVFALDITESGIVAGNADPSSGDPGPGEGTRAERWIPLPNNRYLRQRLAMPQGVTQTRAAAITPRGEVAGAAWYSGIGVPRAVLWSPEGRTVTHLAGPGTSVASGSANTWVIGTDNGIATAPDRFVQRDLSQQPIPRPAALPDGGRLIAPSTGGPRTALLGDVTTMGRATVARHVVHVDGVDHLLPAVSSPWVGTACASHIGADGSVAFSGAAPDDEQRAVLGVHLGGVPGRDVELPNGGGRASLGCTSALGVSDALAPDGGVAGQVIGPDSTAPQAAYWTPDAQLVRIERVPGEVSSRSVAVASGGRVVYRTVHGDGTQRLYLWTDGVRRELALPTGWAPLDVVKLTERGDVLANITLDGGQVRPAVWRVR